MEEGKSSYTQIQLTHREEGKERRESGAEERDGIRKKLEMCIDPIDPVDHSYGIAKIGSQKIGKK